MKLSIGMTTIEGILFVITFATVCLIDVRGQIVRKFPDGFQFGVATASYQIEGAWNVSDKSENIWDRLCHENPEHIDDGTNGDVACDSYHNYKRDVQMIKDLGVDFYRFSISWTRILPSGFADHVSEDGYNYYNNLIDELISNGIKPFITIYHWDLPQRLQDLGGWTNPQIAEWFEDYARVLFELFGDRVKMWATINEPKQICLNGYGQDTFAPVLNFSGIADYLCGKYLLLAHARAWHLYDDEFRPNQKGIIGFVADAEWRAPASDDPADIEAALDTIAFDLEIYTDPIFSETGGFPERVVKRVAERSAAQGYPRSRLPQLSDDEREFIKGTADFFGFNHYSTRYVARDKSDVEVFVAASHEDDLNAVLEIVLEDHDFDFGELSYRVVPWGIRAALNHVRTKYNNPTVLICENGYYTYGGLSDDDRTTFYKLYLDSVLDAIDDGCDIVGYTAWSLMDNFEWNRGLSLKYGLYEVDYESSARTRTPRKSAYFYREVAATRTLNTSFEPVLISGLQY